MRRSTLTSVSKVVIQLTFGDCEILQATSFVLYDCILCLKLTFIEFPYVDTERAGFTDS